MAGSDSRATPDSTAPKTAYTWDARGRLTGTQDRQGHTTAISYDATGFQNTHTRSVGSNTTSFTYDHYGRDSVVTDPLSQATTLGYDLLNRQTSVTQPGAATTTTSFTRNATAHTLTTTVTDPRSLTFTTVLNALGLATAVTDPQAHADSAGYDRNGFLRRTVNRAGTVVRFYYDCYHRREIAQNHRRELHTRASVLPGGVLSRSRAPRRPT